MRFFADLHVHSRYSRATSKDLTLENLDAWAARKGITVVSAGDFTHPAWFKELSEKLEQSQEGLYRLRGSDTKTRFVLSTEVSCMYSKGGAVRRVHLLLLAPSLEAVGRLNLKLASRGNLASDGRPIFGLDAKEVLRLCLEADPRSAVIPAHAWTPWFSVFGSKSGFDSLEECFEELAPHIFAIETGLSSDPSMNWRLSSLDRVALVSNSDAHSLAKLGREANAFDGEVSYGGIMDILRSKDPSRFLFTVEFFPEEGKYHYDGHRACGVALKPEETAERQGRCPSCSGPVTVGVLSRVRELADRPEGYRPENAIPYTSLIPLDEIIADAFGVGVSSKKVREEADRLVAALGSEFSVLLDAERSELARAASPEVAEGIMRVREGKVEIEPGYDGEYGKIRVFAKGEEAAPSHQKTLL